MEEDGSLVQGGYKIDPESEDPAKRVPHDFKDEVSSLFDSTLSCVWDVSNKYEDTICSKFGFDDVIDWTNIEFKFAK